MHITSDNQDLYLIINDLQVKYRKMMLPYINLFTLLRCNFVNLMYLIIRVKDSNNVLYF